MKKILMIISFITMILNIFPLIFSTRTLAMEQDQSIDALGVRSEDLSPLHIAVINNDFECLTKLLDEGADVNVVAEKFDSDFEDEFYAPLHYAIFNDSCNMVKFLIDRGAKLDVPKCVFALRMAVQYEREEIIMLLISLKVDVNTKSRYDRRTPLYSAIARKNRDFGMKILDLLISVGADINVKDFFDYTPLMYAAEMNNLDAFDYLISKGARIDDVHPAFGGLLFFAARSCRGSDVAKKLINELSADVNEEDLFLKRTPIFYAVENGNVDIIKELIDNGAEINRVDKNRRTLLHLIETDDVEMLRMAEFFIHNGIKVDAEDVDDRTPLFAAIQKGLPKYCDLLIKNKANINVVDDADNNLFHALLTSKNNDSEEMLVLAKFLIKKNVNINEKNGSGRTPMFKAIRLNAMSFCNLFIESGLDLTCKDFDGNNILHFIGRYDKNGKFLDIAKSIIKKGVIKINDKNEKGLTPLKVALENLQAYKIQELFLKESRRKSKK